MKNSFEIRKVFEKKGIKKITMNNKNKKRIEKRIKKELKRN